MKLTTATKAVVLAALVFAAPAMAEESGAIDPALKEKVTAQLTGQGYDVRKVQMEDGMIEVYAVKDGKAMELYLDANFKIVKTSGEES